MSKISDKILNIKDIRSNAIWNVTKILEILTKTSWGKNRLWEGRGWFRILISNEISGFRPKYFRKFDQVSSKIFEIMTIIIEKIEQKYSIIFSKIFNKFERNSKENFARLSALATNFFDHFKPIQILKWDTGKYYFLIA